MNRSRRIVYLATTETRCIVHGQHLVRDNHYGPGTATYTSQLLLLFRIIRPLSFNGRSDEFAVLRSDVVEVEHFLVDLAI